MWLQRVCLLLNGDRPQMSIAEEFRDDVFYFPYNMDFRGRTYPVPPNLNILGSDFCRGVLMFDEAKPLGERGMYWLKVRVHNIDVMFGCLDATISPFAWALIIEMHFFCSSPTWVEVEVGIM